MTDIVLVPVTGGNNISAMNNNFDKIEEAINTDILHLKGGNNVMKQDLDLNGHQLLNHDTDLNNPDSLITVGDADTRYYNVSGDALAGNMNAAGNKILNLPAALAPHEPMRKNEVDAANAAQDAVTAANNSKTIRTPEAIPALGNAASRADKLLSFDGSGNPVAIAAASQSATDLELRLANNIDPAKGVGMVGFTDPVAPAYLKTTSDILNAERVSVMRFIPTNLHSDIYDHTSVVDVTSNLNEAINAFINGGCLILPPGLFNVTGISMTNADNLMIDGSGWSTIIQNNNVVGGHALTLATPLSTQQNKGVTLSNFSLLGNALSGRGLQVDRGGWFDTPPLEASVISLDRLRVQGHGSDGIQIGKDSVFGAGNATKILRSLVRDNGRTGIVIIGQSNKVSIFANAIVSNGRDGVEMNQVASTNSIDQNFIADNTRFGVFSFRCEQPLITNNGFNRNLEGAVALSGDPTGSIKYTEAALVMGNLFGDNGGAAVEARELQIFSSKGTNVLANYFYGTGQDVMIYLNDYAEGVFISGNHFKDLTTEIKLKVKAAAINTRYTFDDNVDPGANRNIESNQAIQHISPAVNNVIQTRANIADAVPRWMVRGDGRTEWSSGIVPADVSIERINAGALRVNANVEMNRAELAENSAVPTNKAGYARIYVEGAGATGVVKIRFSDGTTKTFTLT